MEHISIGGKRTDEPERVYGGDEEEKRRAYLARLRACRRDALTKPALRAQRDTTQETIDGSHSTREVTCWGNGATSHGLCLGEQTMSKPEVTIGVCVKNAERTLKEAIESIMNQDFLHELMEVIFVDDGSDDDTLELIMEMVPRINMFVRVISQSWRGLGAARNVVVRNAQGDHIIWVDGDMMLSKDYVGKQVEFMEKNPKAGIAKGRYGLASGANWIATLEIYSRAAKNMVDFNYVGKASSKSMGTGGCIYRVKAIRQVGGFNEYIKGYGEDSDAEYRIRAVGWSLYTTDVEFRDYERHGLEWKDLWRRYFRRGYDTHNFIYRNKGMINLCEMLPPTAFLAGLFHSIKIYKLTSRKIAFLLPLQYLFKMSAWCLGFIHKQDI